MYGIGEICVRTVNDRMSYQVYYTPQRNYLIKTFLETLPRLHCLPRSLVRSLV
jgi:hypothetical protein